MGAVINKAPKQENLKYSSISNSYIHKRRVYEIRSPCQWLEHCYDGKCPAFQRVNGNFYCMREGIP